MKTINVFHYDAFTNKPNMGNPAGIVLEADGLTEEEMQIIAEKVGYNETTFVLSSEVGDIRMRYFTPICIGKIPAFASIVRLLFPSNKPLLK